MRAEVNSAVEFLSGLLGKSRVPNINMDSSKVDVFSQTLHMVMCTHYQNHWFPEKPFKGSAYRCIRIVNQKMDPLIQKAGGVCGLSNTDLLRVLPSELTMWVDPEEVSYRIGEEGSIGVLFDASESSDNEGNSSDSNSTSSQEFLSESPMTSPVRTPAESPVAVRSINNSPVLQAPSPPAMMYQTDMFQSQDQFQQQQQYQYHHQQQHVQPSTQGYFQGCKNEWLRGGYLPADMSSNVSNSQENHMPNFEYFSSAFVSS